MLVATPSLQAELATRGIGPSCAWSCGIERWLFRPGSERHAAIAALPRPILLNVGRVSPEKNLEAFLSLETPGSKVVVGDGPALDELKARFPEAHFMGAMAGEELASAYRSADAFVFPSRTDTFGLVVIEALACGLPVAAYPVAGPLDILGPNGRGPDDDLPATVGALDEDLARAVQRALTFDRTAAAVYGARFGWDRATDQFLAALTRAARSPAEAREPLAA